MLTIAYYFLQVVLCSGMMMGYYWLILRNKRFHQYNRFYLLAVALLSWIVPLIKITWNQPAITSEQPQVMQFLSVVADNNSQIEQTINAQPVSEWNWDLLATGIYFLVAAILFSGMVIAFTRLYRLLRDHSCKSVGDVYLILTQAKGTPFSFFRYIFWNEEIDIRSEAGKQILQHELTHVQQKHSFDKLFIQVMLIFGWFNPFFWLLRKEMDMIHEFIADKKAVNNGDTASLAQMLLTAAYPQQRFALTHPFFFSPIRRRLQMLTNTKNPRYSYIRRVVVLPLLAIVIVLFSFRSKDRRENGEISVATVMENVATDQKQLFNSFFNGIGNFFENKTTGQISKVRSIFYNGRPLTVPTSFRLKDLGYIMVTHLDKGHLNLTPALHITENATDPLFVIDGVKQTGKNAIETLNPDDIDMIQILKGAAALAKYGEAGKEGVIEITTKSFTARAKFEMVPRYPDVLIIVDGEVYKEGLHTINQNEIKSVSILKDAVSIEKYGPEAKNGVMIVTTRSQNGSFRLKKTESPPFITVTSIAKDPLGNIAKNRKVFIKNSIYQGSATGTKVWEETHEVATDNEGVFTVYVGLGTKTSATTTEHLGKIDWAKGPFFINYKVAVYPSIEVAWWFPADNLVDVGTTQMLSIPYALYERNEGWANAKNMTANFPGERSNFLTTDTLGDVKWRVASVGPLLKKYPDTLVWVQGHKIDATNPRYSTKVGNRLLPQPASANGRELAQPPLTLTGFAIDKSPAAIALQKRNPDVAFVMWKDKTHMIIQLKDGTEETYNISKPDSKKRAETKYGKLPDVPEKVAYAGPAEVVVPGAVIGGTISGTLASRSVKLGEVSVVGYGTRRADEPPAFPGGLPAWTKYLERNLDKEIPRKNGAPPGRYTVMIEFDIDEDGTVSNVKVQNNPGYGTREEAIRLIAKGPKWKPATKDGKNIRYTHKLSIGFYVKDLRADLKPTSSVLSLSVMNGKEVTIAPNTTAIVTIDLPGVKKGDPLLVTPQVDSTGWSIYSAWVPEENKVNVRFANYTEKEVKVLASQYKITVVKE